MTRARALQGAAAALAGVLVGLLSAGPPALSRLMPLAMAGGVAFLLLYTTWVRPHIGLVVLVVGIPAQQFVFARLYELGVGLSILSQGRFWKEGLLAVLVGRAIIDREYPLTIADRAALVYLAFIAAYMIAPLGPSQYARLFGARSISSFLLLFLAARYVRLPGNFTNLERVVLVTGLVVAGLGYWNYFDSAGWSKWIDSTGVLKFQGALYGPLRPLPPAVQYTTIGGRSVARAGSIFLSPLVLPYYLAISTSLALARAMANRARTVWTISGVAIAGAILLTLTRTAIVLMPVAILLAFAASKNRGRLFVAVVAGVIVLVPLAAPLQLGERFVSSLQADDPSTSVHIRRVDSSITRLWAHPLGTGLGSSSLVDYDFDPSGQIINESWYFQVGTDVGIAGMALIIAVLGLVLRELWKVAKSGSRLGLAALCALAWIALGGLALHSMADHAVSWTAWLLVGIALRPQSTRSAPPDGSVPALEELRSAVPA